MSECGISCRSCLTIKLNDAPRLCQIQRSLVLGAWCFLGHWSLGIAHFFCHSFVHSTFSLVLCLWEVQSSFCDQRHCRRIFSIAFPLANSSMSLSR
jgi:hypothetical protein